MRASIKSLARWLLKPLVLHRGPRHGIWLTFDDGPHPLNTPRILAALGSAGVRATFFMIGAEMDRFPQVVEAVRSGGHTLAMHGFHHRHAHELSPREQWQDLQRMRAIALRFGVPLRWYRPAYGEVTWVRLVWCLLYRVRIMMWSFESRDSFLANAGELIDRLAPGALCEGDIALFHDDTPLTAEAMPVILQRIQSAGLSFSLPASP